MNQSELAQVLQALVQQQASMLQAHAEGMRLQRVLVEQMLDVGEKPKPLPSAVPEPTTAFQMPDARLLLASLRPTVDSASTPPVSAPLLTPSDFIEPHPVEPIVAAPVPDPEGARPDEDETASAPVREGPEVAGPAPSAVDASVPESLSTARAAGCCT